MNKQKNKVNQTHATGKKTQATAVRSTPSPQKVQPTSPTNPPRLITARVVSLRARPIQAAHLCFQVSGVVAEVNVRIGTVVQQFDRQSLVNSMLQFPTSGDPSLLLYDADGISSYVGDSNDDNGALMMLRAANEEAYAALDQAINARSNAYYAKYADQAGLVQALQSTYLTNATVLPTVSKSQHLQNLLQISQQQWTGLSNSYSTTIFPSLNGPSQPMSAPAVVDHTYSWIKTGEPQVTTTTNEPQVTTSIQGVQSEQVDETNTTFPYTVTTTTAPYTISQTIQNQDYVFRIPYLEAKAQYERAQLSLADELFAETTRQQTIYNYQQVLTNELNSLNLSVYRAQIAYLNTFLTSPFTGIVTGVYKQPGEAVRAGETVVRVEDNSEVYLLGTVVYPGAIQGRQLPDTPGMTATIQTSLYDAGGTSTPLTAEVLTARGRGDDDTWEVVLWYVNDGSSGPILPLDYCFDFDNTTISFA